MNITTANVGELLKAVTECFEERREELCGYDRAIGDGDHGDSMARGAREGFKALDTLPEGAPVWDCFRAYSRAMLATIGGAIGPIFSTVILEIGRASRQSGEIGGREYVLGLRAAADKVMALGGAIPGDKTLVDALVPAADAAEAKKDGTLAEIADAARKAAWTGVQSTISLQAKMGRSHFLREKSVGHQDAGATSLYYMLNTIGDFVAQ